MEIAPAYRIHEVWMLPFDLTIDLLAAHIDRCERARQAGGESAPVSARAESRILSNGKREPDWFATLRMAVGG